MSNDGRLHRGCTIVVAEGRAMTRRKERPEGQKHFEGPESGLGGIFTGLADLVEKLGDLAEKGGDLSRTGEIGSGKTKGVYGFSVKVGLGGEGLKVEPFGNVAKDKKSGRSVVQEFREPMVDVFDEEDHVLVVAEMPGVGADDVQLEIKDDVLTIHAGNADRKYQKEVVLPRSFSRDKLKMSCRNGMLRIKCLK